MSSTKFVESVIREQTLADSNWVSPSMSPLSADDFRVRNSAPTEEGSVKIMDSKSITKDIVQYGDTMEMALD